MSGPVEPLGRRQAGRARADDGDLLARPTGRRLRHDPSLGEAAFDDGLLDEFDGDRILVDGEYAGRLARRGTDPPREFGKAVGPVEAVERVAPLSPVDQVVEVGNDVPERTTVVAERHAAVHAARALGLDFLLARFDVDLEIVVDALGDGPLVGSLAAILDESRHLAHQ